MKTKHLNAVAIMISEIFQTCELPGDDRLKIIDLCEKHLATVSRSRFDRFKFINKIYNPSK